MQPDKTCPCAPHTPQDQARPGGIDDVIGHTTSGSPPSHASHSGHHDDVIVGHECLEAKCVLFFVCRVRAFCQGLQRRSPPSDGVGLNRTCFSIVFVGFWAIRGNNSQPDETSPYAPPALQDQARPGVPTMRSGTRPAALHHHTHRIVVITLMSERARGGRARDTRGETNKQTNKGRAPKLN